MLGKNLPEPEAMAMDVLLVINDTISNVYCGVDEILTCEDEECALELYNSCVEPISKGGAVEVRYIGYVKSGKIIVYGIDGRRVCLIVCRREVDAISMCRTLR